MPYRRPKLLLKQPDAVTPVPHCNPAARVTRRRWLGAPLAATALSLLATLPLPRVGWATTDAQRLAGVRLDAESLRKLETAAERMAVAIKKDPSLVREAKGKANGNNDDDDDDDKPEKSLADIAALYREKAPLRQAIESSGMTVDSFTLTMMALMQASLAWGMAQAVPADRRNKALADTGVPAANIEFVKQNQDWLKRIGQRLQALSPER